MFFLPLVKNHVFSIFFEQQKRSFAYMEYKIETNCLLSDTHRRIYEYLYENNCIQIQKAVIAAELKLNNRIIEEHILDLLNTKHIAIKQNIIVNFKLLDNYTSSEEYIVCECSKIPNALGFQTTSISAHTNFPLLNNILADIDRGLIMACPSLSLQKYGVNLDKYKKQIIEKTIECKIDKVDFAYYDKKANKILKKELN